MYVGKQNFENKPNTVIILVEKPENLLKENVTHMINN